MAYTFAQQLVPSSKYGTKCPYSMTAEYITIHNTANDASAKNEVSYMAGNGNQVSFHVAVDDSTVIQAIPFDRNAWHAGDGNGKGNRASIGIEICYSKSGGTRFIEAEKNAAAYVASLLKERGWGIERVRKHQDWSGKYCPHRTLDMGWQRFLDMVSANLGGAEAPSSPQPSPSNPGGSKPAEIRYRARVGGKWLPEMVGWKDTGGSSDTWAGNGNAIEYLAIKMPGWYQVKTRNGWLPKVYRYDVNDLVNGAAGDGTPILAVRCWYETENPDATGYAQIEYAVAPVGGGFLPNMVDLTDTGGSRDDFAGNGKQVGRFRARLIQS